MAAEHLYTVSELGRDLGITARTLRFYEDQGLVTPRRAGQSRVYSARDRARMIIVLRGKRLGFSLRTIREYLELYEQDYSQVEQTRMLLRTVSGRIEQLQAQRVALDEVLGELAVIQAEAISALQDDDVPRTRRGVQADTEPVT